MRIDRLLWQLRFVKTRGLAQRLVAGGHLRCNGQRVLRRDRTIRIGDVLTIPLGGTVRVLEIVALPQRRGPATEARACYRMLDPAPTIAIAGAQRQVEGTAPP